MAFQLDNSSFMQGAAMKQRQRENLFDQLAQSINRQQWAQEMQLKKDAILADREAKANDPKALADSGMMKAALGEQPSPQEMAAMKVWQAKQRPIFDPVTNAMLGAPDIFSSLALPNTPQGNAPQGNAMPSEQEEPTGINIDQIMSPAFNMPMENRPYRDNIGAESMSQGDIEAALNRTGRMKDTTGMGNTPAGRMKTFDANLNLNSEINEHEAKKAIDLNYTPAELELKNQYELENLEAETGIMFDDWLRRYKETKAMEKEEKLPQDALNIQASFQEAENMNATIKNIYDNAGAWTTGILGDNLKNVPGTPAHDLAANLKTIESDAGLSKLIEVKERGGTFGALQEKELELLVANRAALMQSQSPAQFKENLFKYQQQRNKTMRTIADFYKEKYGELPEGLEGALSENIIDPRIEQAKSGAIFVNKNGERIKYQGGEWIRVQ